MPRNGSGIYSLPAGTDNFVANTTIESDKIDSLTADLESDANANRPIVAGGTGAGSAVQAHDNLSTVGADIASGTTTDLGAATGIQVTITGTDTITAFGSAQAGALRILTFDDALTLTHNATSLILPGGANITTAAGDVAVMQSLGPGNWTCLGYQRASGVPVVLEFDDDLALISTDAGASAGPRLDLYRNNTSGDGYAIGQLVFSGNLETVPRVGLGVFSAQIEDHDDDYPKSSVTMKPFNTGVTISDTYYSLYPTTGGLDLGRSGKPFGDAYLASGAVIDWDNGAASIAHNGSGGFNIDGRWSVVHDSGAVVTMQSTADAIAVYNYATHASFSSTVTQVRTERAGNSAFNLAVFTTSGFSDTEFKFSGNGNGTCDGSWTGGGADYAEFFEWADGNPDGDDRIGLSVVLTGHKIRLAKASDDPKSIIGVVSGNPTVVGDAAWNKWSGKHERDAFGRYIWEDYEVVEWIETPDGKEIECSYNAAEVPEGVTVPKDARYTTLQRRKVSDTYDDSVEYVPRSDRPEWDTIGLMGKLRVIKGQPTGPNWLKMRDVSDGIEEWLVR